MTLPDLLVLMNHVPAPPFTEDLQALAAVRALAFSPRAMLHFINTHGPRQQDWSEDEEGLAKYCGIADEHHCLHVQPHDWLWTLERQATEGVGYFLDPPSRELKFKRVAAFLRALPAPTCGWPESIDQAIVRTEQRTGRGRKSSTGRLDLLVAAHGPAGWYAAVIEAKFGHDLKANPLGDYVRTAQGMGLDRESCAYLVLGLENDRIVRGRLKRNPLWQFVSWRRLLRNLEAEMTPAIDDPDYRRFRRTLFARIH